tara:strand:- start:1190 stop:1792 length:603 start_codon:yes stop_codon:yes gene_type:complete
MSEKKATVKSVNSLIEALKSGETLLVQALKTQNPEKVQLEFAEKMTSLEDNASALLGMFNASDSRFSSGARRAWLTAQIVEVGKFLNINCGDDGNWVMDKERGKEVIPFGILNPSAAGKRFRVKVAETTEPTEYQAENAETSAKRKGAEGEHILHNGQYIFSNTEVVLCSDDIAPVHVFLTADAVTANSTAGIKDEVPGL